MEGGGRSRDASSAKKQVEDELNDDLSDFARRAKELELGGGV
jgi:hypothetical protein